MKQSKICSSMLGLVLIASASLALAYDGSQYAKEATLTIDQARSAAQKVFPGTIVEEGLEHKLGGSGLRYSFDIRANHITHEVAIDAKNGNVLKNTRESKNDDE